ncbi:MAG: HAD-IA family hydrolase [Thermoplasmatales archaeon]|nr:HAD-IA family hydrolase [Thermoplasmatales archaeon]
MLVLFDLDGTIIDSKTTILKCLNILLEKYNTSYSMDELRPLIGKPLEEIIKRKVGSEKLAKELRMKYREIYVKNYLDGTKIHDGVEELLMELRKRKIKTGIITSKLGDVARSFLKDLKISRLFDVIVGEDDSEMKPSPAPVIHACKILKEKPENCVIVGDSEDDIIAGKNAGAKTIAVLWGYRNRKQLENVNPDYVVESVGQLKNALFVLSDIEKEPEAKREYIERLEKTRKGKFIRVEDFAKRL